MRSEFKAKIVSPDNWRSCISNPPLDRPICPEDYPSTDLLWEIVSKAGKEVVNAGSDPNSPEVETRVRELLSEISGGMYRLDELAQMAYHLPEGVVARDYGLIARLSNPGTYKPISKH